MKKRFGDRRARPRFDVVGHLSGTVETWQPSACHNISAGGALIDSIRPFTPGSRLRGRLSARARRLQVWMRVCRSTGTGSGDEAETVGGDDDREVGHLVAVKWVGLSGSIEPLNDSLGVGSHSSDSGESDDGRGVGTNAVQRPERRTSSRAAVKGEAAVDVVFSSTVRVCDLSAVGVLLLAPAPLAVGDRAQLRMRPNVDDFAGDIEVRRVTREAGAADWRVGAAFVGLEDQHQRILESLLVVEP